MPTVLITPEAMLHQHEADYTRLLIDAGLEVRYPDDPTFTRGRGEDETIQALAGVSAILAGADRFTARVIESLPDLRVIARAGVGYDRVDVAAATARNVAVTITPTANHQAVAEQALALMLAVSRNVVTHDRITRQGGWQGPVNRPLRGATLGLVGLGRIGRSTAVRARAFGMKIIACDPYADPRSIESQDIELVDFETLLARAEFVSVHAPLTGETRGLFNQATFSRMKRGSVLINTARGGLVVEADLVEALDSGQLSAAGLDVFETEPLPHDSSLLKLENVVMTPHRSSEETLAMHDMAMEAASCIVTLFRGDWPEQCVVNPGIRENWTW